MTLEEYNRRLTRTKDSLLQIAETWGYLNTINFLCEIAEEQATHTDAIDAAYLTFVAAQLHAVETAILARPMEVRS